MGGLGSKSRLRENVDSGVAQRVSVCVSPGVVKFDLIIHVEAVTLLPKPANETPSCQGNSHRSQRPIT